MHVNVVLVIWRNKETMERALEYSTMWRELITLPELGPLTCKYCAGVHFDLI